MTFTVPYYIVDVFAESKYAGNQLAVFLDADGLTSEEMQRIAKEVNFSETTFVANAPEADGSYRVRIFTPESELPFAGHPTLGTAYVLQRIRSREPIAALTLRLGVGPIDVALEYGDDASEAPNRLWMRQLQPTFGAKVPHTRIADVLGVDAGDIEDSLPVQEVSTGLSSLIVPLRSLNALRSARPNRDKQLELAQALESKAILAFAREAVEPGHDLHVRVFVETLGIPEDPATGSANGALIGYLLRHGLYGDAFELHAEQGYAVGRPSLLSLRGTKKSDGAYDIVVGGRCFLIARGEWFAG
ncbi:PhzF family phenazine biosynthesis protein [Paenibacillus sp.]|uniref:PhzF family phenazine biosynthesis protein n=1 Tax=Paenibacillus sp. TaxID=58172 RepID=UPI002810C3FD|nr:PhzF family phenazine biosynthesis protein [Paenibacillus sp.]